MKVQITRNRRGDYAASIVLSRRNLQYLLDKLNEGGVVPARIQSSVSYPETTILVEEDDVHYNDDYIGNRDDEFHEGRLVADEQEYGYDDEEEEDDEYVDVDSQQERGFRLTPPPSGWVISATADQALNSYRRTMASMRTASVAFDSLAALNDIVIENNADGVSLPDGVEEVDE